MISIQANGFDSAADYQALLDSRAGTGAFATFVELVRRIGAVL